MSHDHGRHNTVRHKSASARAHDRTSLERPSLFSPQGREDEAQTDMQRVHILSTLESARRPPRAAPSKLRRPRPSEAAGKWQMKVLIGLMAAGILSLLTAFVLLLLENDGMKTAEAAPPSQGRTITADRHNPLAALVAHAPPSDLPAPAPQTALIEDLLGEANIEATAAPSVLAVVATDITETNSGTFATRGMVTADSTGSMGSGIASRTGSDTSSSADRLEPLAALNTPARAPTPPAFAHNALAMATPSTAQGGAAQATPSPANAPMDSNTKDKSKAASIADLTPTKPAARRRATTDKDDDIALLEAVMAHSATRKAAAPRPASVAEELQHCDKFSGGAAAICRARICVQNPTTPACHQEM